MKISALLNRLRQAPLVASVQASPKSPTDHPETLLRLARASLGEGVKVLRLEGVKNIRTIKPEIRNVPVIGLLKRQYPGSDVYITPASQDVDSLIELGCEIVAIDGTERVRPNGDTVEKLVGRIHRRGAIAMADCDSIESARAAAAAGADLIGTTLAGYTDARPVTPGPDLELLREIRRAHPDVTLVAEGRYSQRWEVEAALRIGATAVVVGGAINDPVKQTRALFPRSLFPAHANPGNRAEETPQAVVGAVDIGGTWLRFGLFSAAWELLSVERTPNPPKREDRIAWIRDQIASSGVRAVGVSTGGIVDAATGEVWTAKEYLMPDHIGIRFSEETLGVPTYAFGDGHATAWGHACLPAYAGRRVATLAIGTGVGAGVVQEGRIWAGRRGEYPRINDLPAAEGKSYEGLLGGINLSHEPSEAQREAAVAALEGALKAIQDLYFPDDVVVAGGVGLSPWLEPHVERLGAVPTPFGGDAGLYGAAALALFPDWR